MFRLLKLTDDAQAAIYIIIAENAICYFENKEFIAKAKNAIDCCWRWIEKKDINGDELYDLIDSGNDFDIVDLQTKSKSNNVINVWDCIIDSVIYTCRKAYERNCENLPQAIEVANEDLFEHAKSKLISVDSSNEKKIELIEQYFLDNYTVAKKNRVLKRSDFNKFFDSK